MKAFLGAVQFLTVIPVRTAEAPSPARSAVLFPVVGALLGGLAAVVWHWLMPVVPRGLLALLVLAMWAALTGGLHEDGLADTFDAFGGGRTREEILRILKDSRIGTFGALAVVFSVAARWQSLAIAAPESASQALIACQALPRAGIVVLAAIAGGATEGLGGLWAASLTRWHALGAGLLGLGLVALLARDIAGPAALACLGIVLISAWYFRRKIGGVTGDCLGAAAQLQETAVLVVSACL